MGSDLDGLPVCPQVLGFRTSAQNANVTDRLAKFLFIYRTTPHTTTGVTPAELLIGRNPQTRFHKLYPNRREDVEKQQAQQKRDHDKRAKRRHFQPGVMSLPGTFLLRVTNG